MMYLPKKMKFMELNTTKITLDEVIAHTDTTLIDNTTAHITAEPIGWLSEDITYKGLYKT